MSVENDGNHFQDKEWFSQLVKEKIAAPLAGQHDNPPVLRNWSDKEFVGAGASSKRYVATLDWANAEAGFWNGMELPKKLFMKVPTMGHLKNLDKTLGTEKDSSGERWILETHQSECKFYNLWKGEKPPLKILKCYSSEAVGEGSHPHILLDDVSADGRVVDYYEGFNRAQLLQIAEAFGNLHAWSIKNKSWEASFSPPPRENCSFVPPYMGSVARDLEKTFPDRLGDLIKPLLHDIDSIDAFYYGYGTAEALGLKQKVLVHGDCMAGNIFFQKAKDSDGPSNQLLAIYDWQLPHAGTPGEDFSKLFMTSVTPEVRRNHAEEVFRHYYATLCKHFKQLSDLPFSYEEVVRSYKYQMKAGMVWGLLVHGYYTKKEWEANGDSEKFQIAIGRVAEALRDIRSLYSDDELRNFVG